MKASANLPAQITVTVRSASGTFVARCEEFSASSTSSAMFACRAAVRKRAAKMRALGILNREVKEAEIYINPADHNCQGKQTRPATIPFAAYSTL